MAQITKEEIASLLEINNIKISNAEDILLIENAHNILHDILISVGWESFKQDK